VAEDKLNTGMFRGFLLQELLGCTVETLPYSNYGSVSQNRGGWCWRWLSLVWQQPI